MIVLGIDPGTAICGYGVVLAEGMKLKALDYGAVTTPSTLSAPERLLIIHDRIDAVIREHRPDIVGVELLFFNKNVTTAMSVGQARGVILLAAARYGANIAEYTPLQVKQAVVGHGAATKDQVMFMVQRLLKLAARPTPDDVADALAVAVCTAHSATYRKVWGTQS